MNKIKKPHITDIFDITTGETEYLIDSLISVYDCIENSKSDSGAVYLGDGLELRIKETLIKVGCKFEH